MGLREEKKERTRREIAEVAWTLFADRGFDRVTVAQIAAAARVSEATVFNYFDGKEDLFFDRLDRFGLALVDAVAARPAGESALAAFRRLLFADGGLLGRVEEGDTRAFDRLRTVNRVIAESPVLRARELLSMARTADALTERLAADSGDPLTARVVAHALLAVQRSLVLRVRESVLAGEVPTDVPERGVEAFALLEQGLGDYGIRPA
jgi:AcrR family transcriptional regulator